MKSLNTIIRGLDLILTGNKENILSRGWHETKGFTVPWEKSAKGPSYSFYFEYIKSVKGIEPESNQASLTMAKHLSWENNKHF